MTEKINVGTDGDKERVKAVLRRSIENSKKTAKRPKAKESMPDGDLPIVPFDVQVANEIRVHEQKLKQDGKETTPKASHNT